MYKDNEAQADKYLILNAENKWTDTFNYLPVATDYSVKELRKITGGEMAEFRIDDTGYIGVGDGTQVSFENGRTYKVSYSDLENGTITITNQEVWRLIKRSSSETGSEPLLLSGAEFDLKHKEGTIYKGVSGQDGIVTWKKADGSTFAGTFPDGEYTLTETKAPTGYALGNSITFTIKDGIPGSLGTGNSGIVKDGILTFYYDNTALYELPSAAGDGIQRYIIGGMLLTIAGLLVLYRIKRREVSKR